MGKLAIDELTHNDLLKSEDYFLLNWLIESCQHANNCKNCTYAVNCKAIYAEICHQFKAKTTKDNTCISTKESCCLFKINCYKDKRGIVVECKKHGTIHRHDKEGLMSYSEEDD